MTVAVRTVDGASVIALCGDLRWPESHEVREAFRAVLDKDSHLVVDLSDASLIDGAIVANMVEALGRAQEKGGSLELRNVNETVHRILEIFRLDTIFGLPPVAGEDQPAAAPSSSPQEEAKKGAPSADPVPPDSSSSDSPPADPPSASAGDPLPPSGERKGEWP